MILEIVKYGNPVLREKGREVKEVDDKIKDLAVNMLDTMHAASGVGLAAQQVGVPIQLTVVDVAGIEDRPSAMWIGDKEVPIEAACRSSCGPVLKLNEERSPATKKLPQLSRKITAEVVRSSAWRCMATLLDGKKFEFEGRRPARTGHLAARDRPPARRALHRSDERRHQGGHLGKAEAVAERDARVGGPIAPIIPIPPMGPNRKDAKNRS